MRNNRSHTNPRRAFRQVALAAIALTGFLPGLAPVLAQTTSLAQTTTLAQTASTIGLEVEDGIGTVRALPFKVIALDGRELTESADGSPVQIPAGEYLLEASLDASLGADISVKPGETHLARQRVPGSIWFALNLDPKGQPRPFLWRPVDWQRARNVLAATRANASWLRRSRRAGASDGDIAAALEAARSLFANPAPIPPQGDAEAAQRYRVWSAAMFDHALPALVHSGTEADRAMLAALPPARLLTGMIIGFAALEARLGRLEDGHVARMANRADEKIDRRIAALLAMAKLGARGAEQGLLALARDEASWSTIPVYQQVQIIEEIAHLEHPIVDGVSKRQLEAARKAVAEGALPAARLVANVGEANYLRLLLRGSPDERKLLSQSLPAMVPNLQEGLLASLLALSQDPAPLAGLLANTHSRLFVRICPVFRALGAEETARAANLMIEAVVNAKFAGNRANRETAELARAQLTFWLNSCRPHVNAAAYAYRHSLPRMEHGKPGTISAPEWFPMHDQLRFGDVFAQNTPTPALVRQVLDRGPARVEALWRAATGTDWIERRDERIALFRAFSSTGDDRWLAGIADGTERRVYAVRVPPKPDDPHSGALAGLLEIRPHRLDGRLAFDVRLDQKSHYYNDGLATMIATENKLENWQHHAYVAKGGRKLMDSIVLTRGDQTIPLVESAAPVDGWWRFVSPEGTTAPEGLRLSVELAVPGDRRRYDFDLALTGFMRDREGTP